MPAGIKATEYLCIPSGRGSASPLRYLDVVGHQAAVEQVDGAAGVRRVTWVVRHHAEGRATFMELAKQVHHRLAVHGIRVSGGLIGQQNRGVAAQGARHRYALLLAAGELGGIMPHAMRHSDAVEGLVNSSLTLNAGHAPIGERQLDVLVHGQVADQIEGLKNEADLAIADAGALGRLQDVHRLLVQRVNALRQRIEQAEDGQQCRFSAARRTGDGDELAFADVEVDAGKRVGLDIVGDEYFGYALEMDHAWI